MKYVVELLEKKGNDIWSVSPGTPVYEALQLMSDKNCGAVMVLDQDRLVGVLSERDYARKVTLKGRSSKNTPVEEIMSSDVVCIQPSQTIDDCMVPHDRSTHPAFAGGGGRGNIGRADFDW